jgi:hypothetical protein
MAPLQFDPNSGNFINGPKSEFVITDLKSGLGLSGPQVEELRRSQGFELVHKQKIRYILPWLYVFRKWSSKLNRYIYLHQVWDYYEEVMTSCCIFFDGSEDAENDKTMNEAFMSKYINGQFSNIGRTHDIWEVNGRRFDSVEGEFWDITIKNPQAPTKQYEKTSEYYRLPTGDYLQYDKEDDVAGIRIVDEKTYSINMLSKFDRERAWMEDLQRKNRIMKSSPKYKPW